MSIVLYLYEKGVEDILITKRKRFNIEFSDEIVNIIDDYRKEAPGIPDRTNAIRELIRLGAEEFNKRKADRKDE